MKKVLSVACALCMTTAMLTGCGSSNNAGTAATGEAQNSAAASTTTEQASTATDAGTTAGSDTLIALITMDSLDQHWVTLNEGAQKAAAELGVTVQFMAPNTKDDAQQIECKQRSQCRCTGYHRSSKRSRCDFFRTERGIRCRR